MSLGEVGLLPPYVRTITDLGIAPYPSGPREQIENLMTQRIFDLFEVLDGRASFLVDGLFGGHRPPDLVGVPLWPVLPKRKGFGPDLLLVDGDDEVRTITEVKRGAQVNVVQVGSLLDADGEWDRPFTDPVAVDLMQRYEDERTHRAPHHDSAACRDEDGDLRHWHHYRSSGDGTFTTCVVQPDAYRMSSLWLPPGFTIDPARAHWVLFDEAGASPKDRFCEASRPDVWTGSSFAGFVAVVVDHYNYSAADMPAPVREVLSLMIHPGRVGTHTPRA